MLSLSTLLLNNESFNQQLKNSKCLIISANNQTFKGSS